MEALVYQGGLELWYGPCTTNCLPLVITSMLVIEVLLNLLCVRC